MDSDSSNEFVRNLAEAIEKHFYKILKACRRGLIGKGEMSVGYYREIEKHVKKYFEQIGLHAYISAQDDSNVAIKNVIPYSIGLAKNELFRRLIKRNELSGFTTPLKPLLISDLEKDNWRVAVYQSFSNEFVLPPESEEVVVIGDVEIDKNHYTVKDAILFNLRKDDAGQIHFKFFEDQPDEDEPVFIEEKIVKVGG